MKRVLRLVSPLLFLLAGAALFAQATAGATTATQPAQSLHVVVTDKAHGVLTGLSAGDFTVLDNGTPRQVIGVTSASANAEPASQIVIVLDEVNASFQTVSYAREQIAKFLQRDGGRMEHAVTIYRLTETKLVRVAPASMDGNALAAELDKSMTELRPIRGSAGFYGAEDRLNASLAGMDKVLGDSSSAPGHKLVLWISPGWALFNNATASLSGKEQNSIYDSVAFTTQALRRADVTLYVIDPRNVNTDGTFRRYQYETYLKPVSTPHHTLPGNLALQAFAVNSGGLVQNETTDIQTEIAQCISDVRSSYLLQLAPPATGNANAIEYHALKVTVDRPGAQVRTATGYYAGVAESAPAPPKVGTPGAEMEQ